MGTAIATIVFDVTLSFSVESLKASVAGWD